MDNTVGTAVKPDVRIYPDLPALNRAAAEEFVRVASGRAERTGRCAISLAGGNTPRGLYELLATEFAGRIPWAKVHLYWGDERYVPFEDPKSNFSMVCDALLDQVPIPRGNVHPMLTQYTDPDDAARKYEGMLRQNFHGDWPDFDLLLLGTGAEGHTASLFPNSPSLAEHVRWVVATRVPVEPTVRLTLTLPAINNAQTVFFLAAGEEKRDVLKRFFRNPAAEVTDLPISLVRPAGPTIWFLDQAAAG
jgi:6-phosphogluconolactonase